MKINVTLSYEELQQMLQENTGLDIKVDSDSIEVTDNGIAFELDTEALKEQPAPKKVTKRGTKKTSIPPKLTSKDEDVKSEIKEVEDTKVEVVEEEPKQEEKAVAKAEAKPSLFGSEAKESEPEPEKEEAASPKEATKSLFG